VPKLRSIQALRGIAACAVVFHHGLGGAGTMPHARLGAVGVDLFFVISGFIIATVAADKTPRRFIADRVWRIFPLWLIALLPWLVMKPINLPTLLTSLTLWPIWNGAFHMPALGVGWSLSFEMLFYAAFALALATRPIYPLIIFALAFIASQFTDVALLNFTGSPLIFEFLAGVLIARLPRTQLGLPVTVLATAALLSAPVYFYADVVGANAFARAMWWGLPSAFLVYGVLGLERHLESRAAAPLIFLGDASYAIYLFHQLIAGAGNPALDIPAAIALGLAAHWFVERPILNLRYRSRSAAAVELAGEPQPIAVPVSTGRTAQRRS
jgi:exopolysaccharide production protein ExoZ